MIKILLLALCGYAIYKTAKWEVNLNECSNDEDYLDEVFRY